MANVITHNPFVVDTNGILSNKPMLITAILFCPGAAGNILQLNQWDEKVPSALHIVSGTGTITGTNTLTITNAITAGAVGDCVYITANSGAAANLGRRQIESITSDDAIVIREDNWTNEATKVYSLDIYTSWLAAYLKANAAADPILFQPLEGLYVRNLLVHTITAGTAYIWFSYGAYSSNT